MNFDELMKSGANGKDLVVPSSWGQGRASFGGVVAALVFDRMASVVAPGRPMR